MKCNAICTHRPIEIQKIITGLLIWILTYSKVIDLKKSRANVATQS